MIKKTSKKVIGTSVGFASMALVAVLISYASLSVCASIVLKESNIPTLSETKFANDINPEISDAVKENAVSVMGKIGTDNSFFSLSEVASVEIDALSVSAECAALYCRNTGEFIYEKNSDIRHSMASTTKIMTAIVAIEKASLGKTVLVSSDAVGIIGSSIYLYAGEELTMESLLYALMLESANDAAAAIAISVAGSIEDFADMMNEKAAELGLTGTHFTNPHGLDDREHYTTARDLAVLTDYALKNPTFRKIVSTYKQTIPMHNGDGTRLLVNHNKMLKNYDGAIGVKTGYTSSSGRCLVSAAERDDLSFISVTLNAPDDWSDHTSMLDAGFSVYRNVSIATPKSESYTVNVVGGISNSVTVTNTDSLNAVLASDSSEVGKKFYLEPFYYAPITQGSCLGKVVFYSGEKYIGELPLYSAEAVEVKDHKKALLERMADFISDIFSK